MAGTLRVARAFQAEAGNASEGKRAERTSVGRNSLLSGVAEI